MKQRVITALLALAVFLPVIIFADVFAFRIVLAIISIASALELLQCTGTLKKFLLSVPLVAFSAFMPLSYMLEDGTRFAILIAFMLYCMTTMVLSNGSISAQDVGISFIGVFFCTFSYECMAMIREDFSWAFLLVFLSAWISDTFAYFVGKAFGKHKLIPKISPKKTVEGAIGGAVSGVFVFTVFGIIFSSVTSYSVNLPVMAVIGVIAAIVSQIGDLIMSAIKRSYNMKDYGNIFPGHGGFLDRFDSTLTVAPLLCFAFNVFEIIY